MSSALGDKLLRIVDGFLPGRRVEIPSRAQGPLSGTRFAIKDNIDVAGETSGAGSRRWLETHGPARAHAPVVDQLLDAGAAVVGKTVTEELAYSVIGHNADYGAPHNTASKDRFCGGSSSGSAAVVASGFADFALGTDTAGSVRVPAASCGLYGLRPTHGILSSTGVVPLAASFDVVGWLSTSAALMQRVGEVLLPSATSHEYPGVYVYQDAFELLPDELRGVFNKALSASGLNVLGVAASDTVTQQIQCYSPAKALRTLQAVEAWNTHRDWLESAGKDRVSTDILERFYVGRDATERMVLEAGDVRARLCEQLDRMLLEYPVIAFPTMLHPPLTIHADEHQKQQYRQNVMRVTCLSSLTGTPELSLPLVACDGWRMGISILGPRNSDRALLDLALLADNSAGSLHPTGN